MKLLRRIFKAVLVFMLATAGQAFASDCVYYGTRITKTIKEYKQARTRDMKEEKFGLLHFYIKETKSNCRKKSRYYKRAVKASIDYKENK